MVNFQLLVCIFQQKVVLFSNTSVIHLHSPKSDVCSDFLEIQSTKSINPEEKAVYYLFKT